MNKRTLMTILLAGALFPLLTVAVPPASGEAASNQAATSQPKRFGDGRGLIERGLRVPEDVSVCGFDDLEPPPGLPKLTSIDAPFEAMGAAAVQRLAHRVANPAAEPIHLLFTTDVIGLYDSWGTIHNGNNGRGGAARHKRSTSSNISFMDGHADLLNTLTEVPAVYTYMKSGPTFVLW